MPLDLAGLPSAGFGVPLDPEGLPSAGFGVPLDPEGLPSAGSWASCLQAFFVVEIVVVEAVVGFVEVHLDSEKQKFREIKLCAIVL